MRFEEFGNLTKHFDGKLFFSYPEVYPDKNGRDCVVITFDDDGVPIFVETKYEDGKFLHEDDDIAKKVRYWSSEYITNTFEPVVRFGVGIKMIDDFEDDVMSITLARQIPDPVGFTHGFASRNYCPLPNIPRGKSRFMQMLKTRLYIESQNTPVKKE